MISKAKLTIRIVMVMVIEMFKVIIDFNAKGIGEYRILVMEIRTSNVHVLLVDS